VELMPWEEAFSVRNEAIDAQHRKLIETINLLHEGMKAGRGGQVLEALFRDLADYASTHFRYEESLLERHGYGKLDEQRKQHAAFVRELDSFKRDFAEKRLGLSIKVLEFLTGWLKGHILRADREYSSFLAQKGER
jgi:hemerythrin